MRVEEVPHRNTGGEVTTGRTVEKTDRNRRNCRMSRVKVSSGTNIQIKGRRELHARGNTL